MPRATVITSVVESPAAFSRSTARSRTFRRSGAAQREERGLLERIELQVDLEPRLVRGELLGEARLIRDPHAVGVHHQVADRAALRRVEDREEIRVRGGLAAGDLHHVGLALVGDDRIEHALDRRERPVLGPVRAGIRVAHRAREVAVVGDLQDREARVLHVVGAKSAIVRAAPVHLGVEPERHLRRLDVDLAPEPPVRRVARDHHLARTMLGAPLVEPHLPVADHVLRLDAPQAFLAERDGLVVVEVGTDLGHRQALASCAGASRRRRLAVKYAAPTAAAHWIAVRPA
jgi:hypothetical protein